MLFDKDPSECSDALQNQFTAYLVRALRRRRAAYIHTQTRRAEREVITDTPETFWAAEAPPEERPACEPLSFHDVPFENERLEKALWALSDRERRVLFGRAVAGRSLQALAEENGLRYKGAAALYYRSLQKLRRTMEGDGHDLS